MRDVRVFNTGWVFSDGFTQSTVNELQQGVVVTLPHTAVELPLTYFDETLYQKCFTYQKVLHWEPAFEDQEVVLRFDGSMANTEVFINGHSVCKHPDGYTAFEARLTEQFKPGKNLITVKIDGSENPDIPPFGGRIDYLTYAGIYRDVFLRVTAPLYIGNVKIEADDVLKPLKSLCVRCYLENPQQCSVTGTLSVDISDLAGGSIAQQTVSIDDREVEVVFENLPNISLWDIDSPNMYSVAVSLMSDSGGDVLTQSFGFRTAQFTADGFRLNGHPLKLLGLNRHQSFPYSGYAQGRYSQERDVEILKNELSCNVVRTSHYPQSPWFLDHCDKLGLLVLEEIPGWQHIGGDQWKAQSLVNVRHMIERDWNHPSIITWGVRINESIDVHEFYTQTNALARKLDPTRQTHGVRKYQNSEFLEDIYTMNDFSQGQEELTDNGAPSIPIKSQKENTGLTKNVPYMVTEFNGHMYPTKVHDCELRQAEHVTRHLRILNKVFGDPHIAGCTGWCMFDYHTHKDFGSGDRICHHGVLTMFREPKFAGYVYASQGDPNKKSVLEPVTFWARGERNIGGALPLIILTNLDEVELQFANGTSQRFKPAKAVYPHLPHAPVIIERGDVLEQNVGQWGANWTDIKLAGYLDGKEVASTMMVSAPLPATLALIADKTDILASEREEVRVVARALDQANSKLPFLHDQLTIQVDGPASLIGPSVSPIVGGSTGFWIRSTGAIGDIQITVTSGRFDTQTLTITASA